MIYDSAIMAMNEGEFNTLLENVEDRFENYTMAEATATIVGEQEANWTRFMTGVGISELNSIMEGQEVIYEGARMQSFIKKAKGFFQIALNKIAEITKSFMAKVDQLFKSNDSFIKKYEKQITNIKIPKDFKFEGYNFYSVEPIYNNDAVMKTFDVTSEVAVNQIISKKETTYSKESAENSLFVGGTPDGDSLSEKAKNYFYGKKEDLKININEQIKIIKETKDLKSKSKKSYSEAAKAIKSIIKNLEKADKDFDKNDKKNISLENATTVTKAFNILISYWKAYSSAAATVHGTYMGALGARNKQAKAICTKLIIANGKAKGKADRKEIKSKMESYIDTDVFLGAVEFI